MTGQPLPAFPRIRSFSWARVEVEDPDGTLRRFKDAKLVPGGSRAWDWSETGTSHVSGTPPADAEELLEHVATEVVLTRGMKVYVLQSEDAVDRYRAVREEGRAVGGLFHSTR